MPTIASTVLDGGHGASAFAHPTAPSKRLLPAKPLHKHLDIDEAAGVAAVADLALALESFDLEADHAALHRDDFPVTRTVAPTSDAPRWRISTSVPTVIQPG